MSVLERSVAWRLTAIFCVLTAVADGAVVTTTSGYSREKSSPELQCYTCTSYMNECKKSVDSQSGRVSTTPCHSKCFSRRGEDDAIYRGCFDGFVGVPDLKHDFVGCTSQNWNGRSLMWCFCETDLCNGAYINPADSRPKMLSAGTSLSGHSTKLSDSRHESQKYQQAEATLEGKGKLNYVIETHQSNELSGSGKEASNVEDKQRFKIVNTERELQPVEPQTISATISNWEGLKNWEFPGDAKERSERLVKMNRIKEFEPYGSVDYNRGQGELVYLNNRVKDTNHELQDYREPSINRFGWQDGNAGENIAVFYPSEGNSFWNQKPKEIKEIVYNKPVGKPIQRVQAKVEYFGKSSQDNSQVGRSGSNEKSGSERGSAHNSVGNGISAKELVSQIQCKRSGYYQNQNDCTSFIACLLDPGMQIPVVHVMSCPRGLYWDDGHKICLEYSSTCKDGDAYYKQIYNPSPFNTITMRDDLVYHKFPEQPNSERVAVDTLDNVRVKLQEPENLLGTSGGHRNNFKSISVDLDDFPREQLPELEETKGADEDASPLPTLDDVAVERTEQTTAEDSETVDDDSNATRVEASFESSSDTFDERLNQLPRLNRQGRLGYGRKFYEEVHTP